MELQNSRKDEPNRQVEDRLIFRKVKISQRLREKTSVSKRGTGKINIHKRTISAFNIETEKKLIKGKKLIRLNSLLEERDPLEIAGIVEVLAETVGIEEEKVEKNVDHERETKINQQISQAEELIAQIARASVEVEQISLNDDDDEHSGEETANTMMEVTVGHITGDTAIFVTREYCLLAWPVQMLPEGTKKGEKFTIFIKRNTNSEALRENAVWGLQNQILSYLKKQEEA